MELSREQMLEIVAFDRVRRESGSFDVRRYGSATEKPEHACRCGMPCRKTLRYNYISTQGREVHVLHVAVRLTRGYLPKVKAVADWNIAEGVCRFRDIDYRQVAGWVVRWASGDYVSKHSYRIAGKLMSSWSGCVRWKPRGVATFPYHETVNLEALNGTAYEYCQYGLTRGGVGLVDWLSMYRAEPKIELLAKAGLWRLAMPAVLKALKDPVVFKWAREHASEIEAWDRRVVAREVLWAAKHTSTLAEAAKRFRFVTCLAPMLSRARSACPRLALDYDRVRATLAKWGVTRAEFARYICHAANAGFDMRNEGTLYPPVSGGRRAFMARLEDMERREVAHRRNTKRREARRLAKVMQARIEELTEFQASLNRTKVLTGAGYTLVLAKTQKELVREGKRMHNCVGTGMYGEAIVKGFSLIVMVKRGGASWCDIEIDRKTWRVRQCYLKRNELPDEQMRAFADQIAAELKRSWRRIVCRRRRGVKLAA